MPHRPARIQGQRIPDSEIRASRSCDSSCDSTGAQTARATPLEHRQTDRQTDGRGSRSAIAVSKHSWRTGQSATDRPAALLGRPLLRPPLYQQGTCSSLNEGGQRCPRATGCGSTQPRPPLGVGSREVGYDLSGRSVQQQSGSPQRSTTRPASTKQPHSAHRISICPILPLDGALIYRHAVSPAHARHRPAAGIVCEISGVFDDGTATTRRRSATGPARLSVRVPPGR